MYVTDLDHFAIDQSCLVHQSVSDSSTLLLVVQYPVFLLFLILCQPVPVFLISICSLLLFLKVCPVNSARCKCLFLYNLRILLPNESQLLENS